MKNLFGSIVFGLVVWYIMGLARGIGAQDQVDPPYGSTETMPQEQTRSLDGVVRRRLEQTLRNCTSNTPTFDARVCDYAKRLLREQASRATDGVVPADLRPEDLVTQ